MQLSDRITSRELFDQATYRLGGSERTVKRGHFNSHGYYSVGAGYNAVVPRDPKQQHDYGEPLVYLDLTDRIPASMWWLAREHIRAMAGLYGEDSTILKALRRNVQTANLAIHTCADEPTLVEYTPDATAGEADRRLRIKLGRLLKQVLPGYTDAQIQYLDAVHRSEVSSEVEFIEAADILAAYSLAQDSGVGACMSKSSREYGLPEDVHPTMAYNAPGFRLAVLRKVDGKHLSARCLLWENPEDATDKRMVRVYGDSALSRRLDRLGYKLKGLAGAKLAVVPVGTSPTRIAAPYIDGPGGAQSEEDGRWMVRRPDCIQLVTRDTAIALRQALRGRMPEHAVAVLASSAGGYYDMSVVAYDATNYTCAVTGEVSDGINAPPVDALHNGEVVKASKTALLRAGWVKARHSVDGDYLIEVMVSSDTPTFRDSGYDDPIVESSHAREYLGYYKLDTEFYPEATDWVRPGEFAVRSARKLAFDEGTGTWSVAPDYIHIKEEDEAHVWVDNTFGSAVIHKSQLPKTAVRVADHGSTKWWALQPSCVVLTDTKRKVIPDLHEVQRLYDGTWTYTRNAMRTSVLGTTIWVKSGTNLLPKLAALPEQVLARVANRMVSQSPDNVYLSFARNHQVVMEHSDGTRLVMAEPYSERYVETRELTRRLATMTVAEIMATWPATAPATAEYAHNRAHNLSLVEAEIARITVERGVTAAVDAAVATVAAANADRLPFEFRVGDQVRVAVKTTMHRDPDGTAKHWGDVWTDEMDEWVGTDAVVFDVHPAYGVGLRSDTHHANYRFPTGALQLLQPSRLSPDTELAQAA